MTDGKISLDWTQDPQCVHAKHWKTTEQCWDSTDLKTHGVQNTSRQSTVVSTGLGLKLRTYTCREQSTTDECQTETLHNFQPCHLQHECDHNPATALFIRMLICAALRAKCWTTSAFFQHHIHFWCCFKLLYACVCACVAVSLNAKNFGRMFCNSFSTCIFFLEVEIRSCTLIPLLRPEPVHSGSEAMHINNIFFKMPHYMDSSNQWVVWKPLFNKLTQQVTKKYFQPYCLSDFLILLLSCDWIWHTVVIGMMVLYLSAILRWSCAVDRMLKLKTN